MSGIEACGYVSPTPIQERAIPAVLEGRDVLGLAQTGTGKTAAFALPVMQRLLNTKAGKRGPVRVLVLAPTRELALQIHESFIELGKQTGLRSAAVFGGVGLGPQIKALRTASIAVACPGRLLDLMQRGQADLRQVDTLILDEADRMLDMGFLPDIKKIVSAIPEQRQNLLFSATMPREIRKLSDSLLRDPIEVKVANTAPAATVSHTLYPVSHHLKGRLLEALFNELEHENVLIFTRTKHKAKALARTLERKGLSATSLQGNLSQSQRQKALDGFRSGKYRVMVATDIAARGIDCANISHVINYDVPDTAETYTHRIGRTGRAERSGEALTLVTNEDWSIVRAIERTLGKGVRQCRLEGFDYDCPPRAEGRPQQERPAARTEQGRRHAPASAKSGHARHTREAAGNRAPRRSRRNDVRASAA